MGFSPWALAHGPDSSILLEHPKSTYAQEFTVILCTTPFYLQTSVFYLEAFTLDFRFSPWALAHGPDSSILLEHPKSTYAGEFTVSGERRPF